MNNSRCSPPGLDRCNQFRAHFPMQPPHHPVKTNRHREHRASFRSIWPPKEERLNLPLGCPPVVDPNWMIDENDSVGCTYPTLNGRPPPIAVNQPPSLRQ